MTEPIKYKHGYRINTTLNGKRIQKRFTRLEYSDPLAAANEYLHRVELGEEPKTDPSLATLIDNYLTWSSKIQRKSSDTIRRDRQRLGVFLTWADRKKIGSVRKLTVNHIREFQEYFFANAPFTAKPLHRKRACANPHANWEKYRQNVSAFLSWCVERGHCSTNLVTVGGGFRIKLQKKLPGRIFTKEELVILFGHLDQFYSPQVATFFRTAVFTGMRLGELVNLKWQNVDFRANRIHVVKSKSKEVRSIPINQALLPHLQKLPGEVSYVFDSGENSPLYTESWWLRLLNEALRICGLKPARIHDLRHTFGSMLASNGADLVTIKELMGHSDIKTTMGYLHYSKTHLEEAIKRVTF